MLTLYFYKSVSRPLVLFWSLWDTLRIILHTKSWYQSNKKLSKFKDKETIGQFKDGVTYKDFILHIIHIYTLHHVRIVSQFSFHFPLEDDSLLLLLDSACTTVYQFYPFVQLQTPLNVLSFLGLKLKVCQPRHVHENRKKCFLMKFVPIFTSFSFLKLTKVLSSFLILFVIVF